MLILGLASAACHYHLRELDAGPPGDGDEGGDADDDVGGDGVAGDPIEPGEVDPSGWSLASTGGPGPTWSPAMAYDPSSKTVFLYAADGSDHGLWEMVGDTWTLRCQPCAPGPRFGAALVYDTYAQRLLLFGGSSDRFDLALNDELWAYAGDTWTLVIPISADRPSPRWGAAYGFDEVRGVFMLFGGEGGDATVLADLWEHHPDGWIGPIGAVNAPAGRAFASGTWSARFGGLLVYGGFPFSDDMWLRTLAGWSRLCEACSGTARYAAGLVHVPSDPLLLVGGWTGSDEISGTMSFVDSTFAPLLATPTKRDTMAIAYDAYRARVVLFGGNGDGCAGGGDCDETLFLYVP